MCWDDCIIPISCLLPWMGRRKTKFYNQCGIHVFMYCRNEFSVKICMKLWRSSFVTIRIVNMLFVSPTTPKEVAKTHVYPAYQFIIITKGACYTSVSICMNVQYAIFTSLNVGNEWKCKTSPFVISIWIESARKITFIE